jgi:hypothetical protein
VIGAGRAGGDGDREVEREEALAGLGRPAEDSGAAGEEEAVGQALPQGLELGVWRGVLDRFATRLQNPPGLDPELGSFMSAGRWTWARPRMGVISTGRSAPDGAPPKAGGGS